MGKIRWSQYETGTREGKTSGNSRWLITRATAETGKRWQLKAVRWQGANDAHATGTIAECKRVPERMMHPDDWSVGVRALSNRLNSLEQEPSGTPLRDMPRVDVWMIVRSVSRSGMSRVIDPMIITDDSIMPLSALDHHPKFPHRYDYDRQGFIVSGTGMDMGFSLGQDMECILTGGNRRGIIRHNWL